MDAATEAMLARAQSGDGEAFRVLVEPHRRSLKALCYRMSGSQHDAEDLLQESLVKAWRALGGFEARASLKTWLYRIATNACLDALERRPMRQRPQDLGPAADPRAPVAPPTADPIWLEPAPDELFAGESPGADARYDRQESVALAFLAALQLLPPKQRAVLILRDVLGWQASECAELLDLSVTAINSALQRARETLAKRSDLAKSPAPATEELKGLVARYVSAWEQADVGALVRLLHQDASLAMPPFSIWLSGPEAIGASIGGMVLPPEKKGHFRFLETQANFLPAVGAYQLNPETGRFEAAAIHVLRVEAGAIVEIMAFLDPRLFPLFGLPLALA
ncbi:MAG: RNA polymerase subunit sigma-70 [Myxococcota bacterium]